MNEKVLSTLKEKCSLENMKKLMDLNNPEVLRFIEEYVELCNPDSVFIRTDSAKDIDHIRNRSKELGEEIALNAKGHTMHFDSMKDQARDKANTKFLVTPDMKFGAHIHSTERNAGLAEVKGFLKDIMVGKQMYILFMCLGPVNSDFSIYAVQITDSAYVAHSEDILYRPAYEAFKSKDKEIEFFKYVHSAGELENNVSKNVDKRRVYMDLVDGIVFTTNTQYAGNTVGLKKLSLRLAINKADKEGWLAEHMFLLGVKGPNGRKSYFTGAYPSACGKTSTCMVKGEGIVGDDIAYLRKKDGSVYAVNVERGIFGIIKDVNSKDDPLIWDVLTTEGEVIFSNVLNKEGVPYWQGDGRKMPDSGVNYSGDWIKGKKDANNKEILYSHSNARYTIPIKTLKNCDAKLEDPQGAKVDGIIYGGRDSDTWPPVFQSLDWAHGVVTLASSLESETTSATIGQEGVRNFCLMANLDFLSIPVGNYIQNHLKFVDDITDKPIIFGANYFLKDKDGQYISGKHDKRVWLKWMELRVHGDVEVIETPIGLLPKYEDIQRLFKEVLDIDFTKDDYNNFFKIRVKENISKIDRILEVYKNQVVDAPEVLFALLNDQKKRLVDAQKKYGDYIEPEKFN
ncbi:MAG: phosphoenolpyruvate carboxykinase (GTP) [Candidatus Omnitrophica bacterium]|nr:phosphoenolpyruvate carboxykinase (GTP) [Candidatus Omnitrophota bacterium]